MPFDWNSDRLRRLLGWASCLLAAACCRLAAGSALATQAIRPGYPPAYPWPER